MSLEQLNSINGVESNISTESYCQVSQQTSGKANLDNTLISVLTNSSHINADKSVEGSVVSCGCGCVPSNIPSLFQMAERRRLFRLQQQQQAATEALSTNSKQ